MEEGFLVEQNGPEVEDVRVVEAPLLGGEALEYGNGLAPHTGVPVILVVIVHRRPVAAGVPL